MPRRTWKGSDLEDPARATAWLNELGLAAFAGEAGAAPPAPPKRSTAAVLQNTGIAGHGWVQNGSGVASQNLNDTSDFCFGSQSAKVTSTGAGGTCQLRKLAGTSADLTGKQIVLWVKVDDITHLSQVTFYAGDTSLGNFFRWTVFLRGSANYYNWRSGEWMRITINWQDLASTTGTPNRAAVTDWQVFFTDDNTGNGITGHVQAIAAEAEPSTKFSSGVVSLVFDDGYGSQYTNAMGKLSQYGYPATAYVISDLIGTAGRLTLQQIQQLQNANGWEIACHSFTQADHDAGFETLTAEQVEENVIGCKEFLLDNGLRGYNQFAYPMGHWTATTRGIMSKYFQSSRLIDDSLHETFPPSEPQLLRCHTTINTDTTTAINTLIDNAFTNHGWLILLFHDIQTTATQVTQYSIANFGTIVDHINTKGIAVATVGDVLAS